MQIKFCYKLLMFEHKQDDVGKNIEDGETDDFDMTTRQKFENGVLTVGFLGWFCCFIYSFI